MIVTQKHLTCQYRPKATSTSIAAVGRVRRCSARLAPPQRMAAIPDIADRANWLEHPHIPLRAAEISNTERCFRRLVLTEYVAPSGAVEYARLSNFGKCFLPGVSARIYGNDFRDLAQALSLDNPAICDKAENSLSKHGPTHAPKKSDISLLSLFQAFRLLLIVAEPFLIIVGNSPHPGHIQWQMENAVLQPKRIKLRVLMTVGPYLFVILIPLPERSGYDAAPPNTP